MLVIDIFFLNLVLFAVDYVVSRTVSQLFTCGFTTYVSNWFSARLKVTLCGWQDVKGKSVW